MKKLISLAMSVVMLITVFCSTCSTALASNIRQIGLGVTTNVAVGSEPLNPDKMTAFVHVAEKNGKVYFYSTGDVDTYCFASVNDASQMIHEDDNYGENFVVELDLNKGDMVVFVPISYEENTKFSVTLSDKAPADYVPCLHENIDTYDKVPASCTEDGFTGSLLCDDCNKQFEIGMTVPKASTIRRSWNEITYTGTVQRPQITVIDRTGKQLQYNKDFKVSWSNFNSKDVGTYTVTVTLIGDYEDTRTYTYKIVPQTNVTPKLNRNTITCNGTVQRPIVTVTDAKGNALVYNKDFKVSYSNWNSKDVGRYTVTVTMMGNYSGQKTFPYYINPKPTSFKTSAQGGFKAQSKGFTLSWNKQSDITGYQIQYATRSDFSNGAIIYAGPANATSKTITGRAGNTRYYVRIRTYKNINGSYFYSDWSTGTKSVVTLR